MNKHRVEILQKQTTRNQAGVASAVYVPIDSLLVGSILPMGDKSALHDYGYSEKTTHQAFTREKSKAKANTFLRFENRIFYIKYIAEYPRHCVLLMELVQ